MQLNYSLPQFKGLAERHFLGLSEDGLTQAQRATLTRLTLSLGFIYRLQKLRTYGGLITSPRWALNNFYHALSQCTELSYLRIGNCSFAYNLQPTTIFKNVCKALQHLPKLTTLDFRPDLPVEFLCHLRPEDIQQGKETLSAVKTVYFNELDIIKMTKAQLDALIALFPNVSTCIVAVNSPKNRISMTPQENQTHAKVNYLKSNMLEKYKITVACALHRLSQTSIETAQGNKCVLLPLDQVRDIATYVGPAIENKVVKLNADKSEFFIREISQFITSLPKPRSNWRQCFTEITDPYQTLKRLVAQAKTPTSNEDRAALFNEILCELSNQAIAIRYKDRTRLISYGSAALYSEAENLSPSTELVTQHLALN